MRMAEFILSTLRLIHPSRVFCPISQVLPTLQETNERSAPFYLYCIALLEWWICFSPLIKLRKFSPPCLRVWGNVHDSVIRMDWMTTWSLTFYQWVYDSERMFVVGLLSLIEENTLEKLMEFTLWCGIWPPAGCLLLVRATFGPCEETLLRSLSADESQGVLFCDSMRIRGPGGWLYETKPTGWHLHGGTCTRTPWALRIWLRAFLGVIFLFLRGTSARVVTWWPTVVMYASVFGSWRLKVVSLFTISILIFKLIFRVY